MLIKVQAQHKNAQIPKVQFKRELTPHLTNLSQFLMINKMNNNKNNNH